MSRYLRGKSASYVANNEENYNNNNQNNDIDLVIEQDQKARDIAYQIEQLNRQGEFVGYAGDNGYNATNQIKNLQRALNNREREIRKEYANSKKQSKKNLNNYEDNEYNNEYYNENNNEENFNDRSASPTNGEKISQSATVGPIASYKTITNTKNISTKKTSTKKTSTKKTDNNTSRKPINLIKFTKEKQADNKIKVIVESLADNYKINTITTINDIKNFNNELKKELAEYLVNFENSSYTKNQNLVKLNKIISKFIKQRSIQLDKKLKEIPPKSFTILQIKDKKESNKQTVLLELTNFYNKTILNLIKIINETQTGGKKTSPKHKSTSTKKTSPKHKSASKKKTSPKHKSASKKKTSPKHKSASKKKTSPKHKSASKKKTSPNRLSPKK